MSIIKKRKKYFKLKQKLFFKSLERMIEKGYKNFEILKYELDNSNLKIEDVNDFFVKEEIVFAIQSFEKTDMPYYLITIFDVIEDYHIFTKRLEDRKKENKEDGNVLFNAIFYNLIKHHRLGG